MDLKQDSDISPVSQRMQISLDTGCQSDVKEHTAGARDSPQISSGMFRKLVVNKTVRQRRRFTVAVSHTW